MAGAAWGDWSSAASRTRCRGAHPARRCWCGCVKRRQMMSSDQTADQAGVVMRLAARTVVGVFDRLSQADAAVQQLQIMGYATEDLSVVLQPRGGPPELGAENTHADQETLIGASAGAILGGAVGLVALAIPGVGPLLAAGPLAATLG